MRLTLTLSQIEDPELYELLAPLAYRDRARRLRGLLRQGLIAERGTTLPQFKPASVPAAAPSILDGPEFDPRNFSLGKPK